MKRWNEPFTVISPLRRTVAPFLLASERTRALYLAEPLRSCAPLSSSLVPLVGIENANFEFNRCTNAGTRAETGYKCNIES